MSIAFKVNTSFQATSPIKSRKEPKEDKVLTNVKEGRFLKSKCISKEIWIKDPQKFAPDFISILPSLRDMECKMKHHKNRHE